MKNFYNFIIHNKFINKKKIKMPNFTKSQQVYATNKILPETIKKKPKIYAVNKKLPELSLKHFPGSTREWKNSIYQYNKNNLNLIPTTDSICLKVIKGFFSLYNKNIESKLRTKEFENKFRKRSLNKTFLSNGEFKHTNDRVKIFVYTFDRQTNSYKIAMQNLAGIMKLDLIKDSNKLNFFEKYSFKSLIEDESPSFLSKKLFLTSNLDKNIFRKTISNYINIYIKNFFSDILEKQYEKISQYYLYKQLLYINKSKYTYSYIQYLKQQIYKIYNKKTELNITNVKRFYLNSDILSESITKRISNKREKLLNFMKNIKRKILVLEKNSLLRKHSLKKKQKKEDLSKSHKSLIKNIKKTLKYRYVSGFRLEAKGRLTKRYTAARSILKVSHKGNLLNMFSSFKGLSSVLLKGNLKSSLQYTKLASKSRIGSFGIKSWVSSY